MDGRKYLRNHPHLCRKKVQEARDPWTGGRCVTIALNLPWHFDLGGFCLPDTGSQGDSICLLSLGVCLEALTPQRESELFRGRELGLHSGPRTGQWARWSLLTN